MKEQIKILKGYVLYGAIIGGLITIISVILTNLGSDVSYGELHQDLPALYFIDLMPLLLAGTFYIVGARSQKIKNKVHSRLLKQIEIVEKTSLFAEEIGKGHLESDFNIGSEDDILGNALLKMRENLQSQAKEEEVRNWIVQGTSEVGNILRNFNKVNELGYEIVRALTPKLEAVQGAFYEVREAEKQDSRRRKGNIKQIATFAYNRKKYIENEFSFGQGLVGQCAMEMDIIHRREIPDEYVSITSGLLDEQKPTNLIIVPLISENKLYGIMEFAGFVEFTEKQIQFLQELSEIIARSLFNISTNENTLKLLNEVNKSQERTEKLLANASEVITIIDAEANLKYVSPSVSAILGYNANDILNTVDLDKVYEEDKNTYLENIQKLLETPEKPLTWAYQYKSSSGDQIWVETTGRNLFSNPAIEGILLNTTDITERRKAEAEQRERAKMQALSENSPDIIIRIDLEGNFSYVNPIIEKFTGLSTEKFLTSNIDEIKIDERITAKWKEFKKKLEGAPKALATEMEFPTHKGEELFMEVNCIPEFDEKGMLESILYVIHDITEAKEAEKAIQEANHKVMDSINYAKRIQASIMPKEHVLTEMFPKSFMLFRPRDIVSGDYPFFVKRGDWAYVCAVDCTGHGVPGALLSIIGSLIMQEVIRYNDDPTAAELNDMLHKSVVRALRQGEEGSENERDGMDCATCKINLKDGTLEYSGAHRPLYIIRTTQTDEDDLEQIKGDGYPIGGVQYRGRKPFSNNITTLNKGDKIFFFSDGFPDQFGGPGEVEKKYGPKRIRRKLIAKRDLDMPQTKTFLNDEFENWKRKDEMQMDDVLFIGIEY